MFWNLEPVLSYAGDFMSSLHGVYMSSHYAFLKVLYLLVSFMTKGDNMDNVRVWLMERISMLSSQSNSNTLACKACDHSQGQDSVILSYTCKLCSSASFEKEKNLLF